jgi:hypothetical protein
MPNSSEQADQVLTTLPRAVSGQSAPAMKHRQPAITGEPCTLGPNDWCWRNDNGHYNPDLFEQFLIKSGFRHGRKGQSPALPDWAIEETEDQHRDWRKRGIRCDYTYFARARWTGRIKIGHTTRCPHERASELIRSRNGEEAELLASLRGKHFERLYQTAFYTWHLGAEWFAPHPDILAEVERLRGSA